MFHLIRVTFTYPDGAVLGALLSEHATRRAASAAALKRRHRDTAAANPGAHEDLAVIVPEWTDGGRSRGRLAPSPGGPRPGSGRKRGTPNAGPSRAGVAISVRVSPRARAILAQHDQPGVWLSALIEASARALAADDHDGRDPGDGDADPA